MSGRRSRTARRRTGRIRPGSHRVLLGALGIAAGGATLAGLVAGMRSRRLVTTPVPVALRGLPSPFEGFRILQLSDLHATVFGPGQRDLLAAVDRARPDLVVLTGDILDRGTRDLTPLLTLAEELLHRAPVLAVTGNHEGGSRRGPALVAGLEGVGVQVLRDRVLPLDREGAVLRIAGIDDPRLHGGPPSSTSSPAIDHHVAAGGLRRAGIGPEAKGEGPVVLLSHRPELLDVYAAHAVDLVLAGHAHGGQWRVPGIGGLYAPGQGLLPRLTAGVHTRGGTQMVISRGLKVRLHLPRIHNPPELVLVVLSAA